MRAFKNSKYHDSVLNVKRFMFEDIDRTLSLKTKAPNFLLALGLCCYTEYWGKLKLGQGQNGMSRSSFEAFLDHLDHQYYPRLKAQGIDIYKDIRCGLAHAYLIEGKTSSIDTIFNGNHGIDYDPASNQYRFFVRTYFMEFKAGVNNYIHGLETETESVDLLEQCLNGRPMLI